MRRLIFIILAITLINSCAKLIELDQPMTDIPNETGTLPEILYASMADEDEAGDNVKTRTYVVNDKDVLWHNGDAIAYIGPDALRAKYVYEGEDGASSAEFTLKDNIDVISGAIKPSVPYVVYPYSSGAYCKEVDGVNTLVVNYPSEQSYAPNSFGRDANLMVGVGETADATDFYFRNACGYLVIKLYNAIGTTKVKNIELTALGGEKLSGMGYITASSNAAPAVAMDDSAKSTVSLNCGDEGVVLGDDKEHATEFWFALPPVTFEKGFKILVTPTEGQSFEMQTSKKVEVTRNDIRPMAALQFTQNVQTSDRPAPNQLFYTTDDDSKIAFYDNMEQPFDANITGHYYDESIKKFVIECDAPITEIKDNAFRRIWNGYGNEGLISVSLPSQLKTIGSYAFYANPITELVIPGNVTLIKNYAFKANSFLQRVTFLWGKETLQIQDEDGALTEAYSGPFRSADLEYIYVDRDIEYKDENGDINENISVSMGLFKNSRDPGSTTEVNIGPNMSTIPASMFAGVSIVKLVIPGNITSIGKNNFYNRHSLEEITFLPSADDEQLTMDGTYNIGDTGPFYLQSSNGDKLKTVRLNREINYILEGIDGSDEGIFSGRSVLETLELGPQVKTISNYMFADTKVLTSVNVPSTVTTIGESAFKNCDGLTSVTISSSTLGSYMFDGCDNLATVTIDGVLDIINADAFSGCSNLSTLNISGQVGTIGTNAFKDKDKMTSFTVTGSVGTIGASAFEDSDALETVNITGVVNEVCEYAFADCDNLTTLSIRANTVGDYAYEDMDGLKSATLYGATVGDGVFYDCNALQTVTIDGGVNSIGDDAFYNCGKLSSVTFNESVNTLTIGYQPSSTDDLGPFYQSPLATINLNRELEPSVTYKEQLDDWDMGIFTNKHYNVENLTTTVTLGSNVKTIWPWMFSCVRMQNIEIPASVTSIGKEAFSYCYILDTVTCNGTTAPTLGENVFYDSDKLQNIYVPSGSWGSYQLKWSDYIDLLRKK